MNAPYKTGIGGFPVTPAGPGAAGMFPTFCTETPTWRCRKVGWIERRTKVTSYRAPGTSRNDDEPIHVFVPVQSAVGGSGAGSVHVT